MRPLTLFLSFIFCTYAALSLTLTSSVFLQATFFTLRAAQAGLTPASGVKVGICIKILQPKVQMHFYNIVLSHSRPMTKTTCIFYLLCAVEEYLYVVNAPGQQLTEAQTRTPLLGPTGPACTLSFDFALTGNFNHIGEQFKSSFGLSYFQIGKDSDLSFIYLFFLFFPMWLLQESCLSGWLTTCWACSRNCGSSLERRAPMRRHGGTSTWLSGPENIVFRSALLSELIPKIIQLFLWKHIFFVGVESIWNFFLLIIAWCY